MSPWGADIYISHFSEAVLVTVRRLVATAKSYSSQSNANPESDISSYAKMSM